jgi:peptide/nickel transport system ATP-binding protein
LLRDLRERLGMAILLITHNLGLVGDIADRVAVMYAGQIVETSDAHNFFTAPLHPYSQKLMASVPRLRGTKELEFITGQPPSLVNPPEGCRFKDRCSSRFEKCDQAPPVIEKEGRKVRCWLYY